MSLIPWFVALFVAVAALTAWVFARAIMRAYVKTPANRAFVRTGGFTRHANNPPRVVMNGGAWVFRTIHEITWVDLGTMAIEIERTEDNALLTIDPQYADIKAIFYIKVNPTVEGIMDAARTIGGKQVDAAAVKQLVDAKLDGALRDVAASFTLMSLHQEREKFIQEVQNRLKTDLEENGLTLESVSILTLRAARQGSFGTDDVFGAQVARANAQVIQQAVRERNDIERRTEIEIKERDIATAKQRLELDQALALATASQERAVRTNQAAEKAQADQRVSEEEQKSEMARVAKERAVRLAELERDQQLAIQAERKQQEVMAAEVIRRQAVELAEQQRQIAVLQEQQRRETAEKDRLLVSAQREDAAQALKAVEATQTAQREARIRLIEAEREAQEAVIAQKNKIELAALQKQREAEAQARALKEMAAAEAEAALQQAETLRTQAQAEMEAEKLRADAARATASASGLAEAEVLKARAEAAMREAEAVRARGLAEAESQKAKAEALAAFEGVAQRVEVLKLQLEAQVQIEVAKAQALGTALGAMHIKMIGDPQAAASLLRLVTLADGLGEVAAAAPAPVRAFGQQLAAALTGQPPRTEPTAGAAALAQRLPELLKLIDQHLDVNALSGQTVAQVLTALSARVDEAQRAEVAQAQALAAQFPLVGDLPFEEVYLRATAK